NPPIVASNSTPGTWSAPPAPSLFVTLEADNKSPSGEATHMHALLTLTDTAPDLPFTYRVPVDLPPTVNTLKKAADALGGYSGFDWTQTITVPDPAPERQCNNDLCDHPLPISGPTPDVPMFGWDYCNPNSANYDKPVFE